MVAMTITDDQEAFVECEQCGTEYHPGHHNRCPACNWKNKAGQ